MSDAMHWSASPLWAQIAKPKPRQPRKKATGWTALYRHFDDMGVLLYVGISMSALGRLAEHEQGSRWKFYISRVEIEWHPTRERALEAERLAIEKEGPVFNARMRNEDTRRVSLLTAKRHADEAEARCKELRWVLPSLSKCGCESTANPS